MKESNSYGQILKSSSIMGGAASITMLIGMVRIKCAAVLIGTGGIGLLATFTVIQGLFTTVAGLGVQGSAVRDIARAVASNDEQALGRSALALQRICWITGFLGLGAMLALSPLLSQWTFGNEMYTQQIAMLGLIILVSNVSGGQMALIQGVRRIADLARVNIISAVIGSVAAIALYSLMGLKGIVPALIISALIQLITSWYYLRRVHIPTVSMSWMESFREAGGMVRLGIALMWNGLFVSIVAYITNALITQQFNLEAVGIYAAAFALSGMFVNFVLNAMGADYFPRLTELAPDKAAMNRLVNKQVEIGLLIATPGLLATMSFGPWIIQLFYTSAFLPANELLQWFILGCFGRVISWPLGYVLLALGEAKQFFFNGVIFNLLHISLIAISLRVIGLEGVAFAFFVSYIGYALIVYVVIKRLIDFSWSNEMRRLFMIYMPIVATVFLISRLLPLWLATILGSVVTIFVLILCLRGLTHRIGYDHRLIKMLCRVPGMRSVCGLP